MTNNDVYPCYVKLVADVESDDILEIPTQENGTILLSTIEAQYPNSTGLKYKSESGDWVELTLTDDNAFNPPEVGWGEKEYFLIPSRQDTSKRKTEECSDEEPASKAVKRTREDKPLSDLIVLGLPFSTTEDEVKTYFEKFGELEMLEMKCKRSGESRGFAFIRFKTKEVTQKVLKLNHNVGGRRCEVKLPKKQEDTPTKLFVGRLKDGTTTQELSEHFSAYGDLTDVYIPKTFRGFGFITFDSQDAARAVLKTTHIIKGSCVNISYADPKGSKNNQQDFSQQNYGEYNNYGYQMPPYGGGYSSYNTPYY